MYIIAQGPKIRAVTTHEHESIILCCMYCTVCTLYFKGNIVVDSHNNLLRAFAKSASIGLIVGFLC